MTPTSNNLLSTEVVISSNAESNLTLYKSDKTRLTAKTLEFSIPCDKTHALTSVKLQGDLHQFNCVLDIGVMPTLIEKVQKGVANNG